LADEPPGESRRFAETEQRLLLQLDSDIMFRVLIPGTGPAEAPLITIEELSRLLAAWSPLRATRTVTPAEGSRSFAFCAMPFHEDFLDVYFLGIVPAVREVGLDVLRTDQSHDFRRITARVWEAITSASLVVADLSGHNPNVMYEAGLAHAFGSRTFVLKDDSTEIPFDVKDYMVWTYNRRQLHRLTQELPARLQSALEHS
jgi:hypothetical protein